MKTLPKIEYPTFKIFVPSLHKHIDFRVFLTKEEKILLIAQESGDLSEMVMALKQIIKNCSVDPSVNVDEFALFDIEYVFLKLRSRSVGNKVEVNIFDEEDEKNHAVSINLDDVEITDVVNDQIVISPDLSLQMKYPRAELISKIIEMRTNIKAFFDVITQCISSVSYKDQTYNGSDYTPEQMEEFVDQLDDAAFTKIREFFDKMPVLNLKVKYTNDKGTEKTTTLSTLADFFLLG